MTVNRSDIEFEPSSGNVFADIGFANAKEMLLKLASQYLAKSYRRNLSIPADHLHYGKDSGLKSLSAIDSRYAFGAILLNILQIIFSITEPQTL